jgi:energy-converting hydrogenase Eha subunit C
MNFDDIEQFIYNLLEAISTIIHIMNYITITNTVKSQILL